MCICVYNSNCSFDRGQKILLFAVSRPALSYTQPPMWFVLGAFSPRLKWPGCEADISTQFTGALETCGTVLPLPHTYLRHVA